MAVTNTVKCQNCGLNYWRHGVDKRACDCWNPVPAEDQDA